MSAREDRQAASRRWPLLLIPVAAGFFAIGLLVGKNLSPEKGREAEIEVSESGRPVPVKQRPSRGSFLPAAGDPGTAVTLGGVRPDRSGGADAPAMGISEALGLPNPALRQAALVEAGYALAGSDLEGALGNLDSLESRADRDAFLKGMFAFAASHQGVGEIFKLVAGLDEEDRVAALFAALDTLTESRPETRARAENFTERFGVEAGVGMALSLDPVYRPEYAADWIAAFGDTDSAGVVIGSLASLQAGENFDAALAMGAGLSDWDREMFFRAFGDGWSQREPADAWAWARQHAVDSGPGGDPILATVLRNWGRKDFPAAERAFNELTDPEQRRLAARSLAQVQTWDSGTAEAVHWANRLPTEAEKDAAHTAIAEYSPQGIGVALGLKDGFAVINKVVPEGAAARDGRLRQGDRIVEVDPGTGQFQNIYGRDLSQAINLIRGESGSSLRLRVIRQDESGNFRDRVVELTREQLVLEGS